MHECVCMCVDQRSSSLSGWALCFDFFLFFSPFQCFPPLLCSKDKFGRFAKFITFHLRIPTPFTLPQLPPPPPSSRHLLATCADLLVLSFVPHSHSCEFVMLRARLGSGHCPFYQPSMEPSVLFIWLWHTTHTHTLCFRTLFGKRNIFDFTSLQTLSKRDLTFFFPFATMNV